MRRRKTKYNWLIPIGTTGPGADTEDDSNGLETSLAAPSNGTTVTQVFPLVSDVPSDDFAPTNPIGFYQGNDYFIKRIVGKCFGQLLQDATTGAARGVLFGVGLFVARADDADQGGPTLPIGAQTATQLVDNYSALRVENNKEPWIWRRVWCLGNILSPTNPQTAVNYPQTTANYGSVADGPHIDAKTARRVRDGERLWASFSARNLPLNSTTDATATVHVYLDYRVLGAIRKARNSSAF